MRAGHDRRPANIIMKEKKKVSSGLIAVIIVAAVIMVALIYYFAFLSPMEKKMRRLDQERTQVETEIETAKAKVNDIQRMQAYLDDDYNKISKLQPYANIKQELKFLNNILNSVLSLDEHNTYNITFADPYVQEDTIEYVSAPVPAESADKVETADPEQAAAAAAKKREIYTAVVRRPISISISTTNYKDAYEVLKNIEKSSYRNLMSNVSVASTGTEQVTNGGVTYLVRVTGFNENESVATATINMEFIETLKDVTDYSGITIPEPVAASEEPQPVNPGDDTLLGGLYN